MIKRYTGVTRATCSLCLWRSSESLAGINWHTLRRTHATLLQHAGATLKEAQAQMGHSKMSTTLEIYTISIPAAQRKAVENLSVLVTNGDELAQLGEELPLATERIQ